MRFPRGVALGGSLDPDPKPLPIGRGELLREGCDVALVGLGKTVPVVLEAAERLAERGVSAAVVDGRFVKPLDIELLSEVGRSCGVLVTVEDHVVTGGFGSAVLEALSPRLPGVRIERIGLPDRFVEHGDVNDQWREVGMDAASIVERTMRCVAVPVPSAPRAVFAGASDA